LITEAELKSALKRYNISPKKYLGQNFLVDEVVVDRMIRACRFVKDDWVLEIGAGLGVLTRRLAREVKNVLAVEKDRNVCVALTDMVKGSANINIICDDFMELDIERTLIEAPEKIKVIGNLPYYITSPIIEKLITSRLNFESIYITVQKEVAERICASPGGKDYGSLSVFVQFYTKPRILLNIGRDCFYPEPEVDSSFVELMVLQKPSVDVSDADKFFAVVKAGFGQRRKTLLNSLLSSEAITLDKNALAELLEKIDIDPGIRAEELSLEQFARIANAI
jgi:16S rRNA (adenine1518-N6/adenine1519-N6)-dimethyltransferase